ncbi:MAG: ExeA family protein, partial [bacterium]
LSCSRTSISSSGWNWNGEYRIDCQAPDALLKFNEITGGFKKCYIFPIHNLFRNRMNWNLPLTKNDLRRHLAMYEEYYGLSAAPFQESTDPAVLFIHDKLKVTLQHILSCFRERRGHVLLTGDAGVGKSIFARAVANNLTPQISCAYLNHAIEIPEQLIRDICTAFAFESNDTLSKAENVMRLHHFLGQLSASGSHAVLVIDSAENLKDDIFEELRLLADFESPSGRALQICFVGRPEVLDILQRPQLHHLNERINEQFQLQGLAENDINAYIAHRLDMAGYQFIGDLFHPAAVANIFSLTEGVPRKINTLCENALILGSERGVQEIDADLIQELAATLTDVHSAHNDRVDDLFSPSKQPKHIQQEIENLYPNIENNEISVRSQTAQDSDRFLEDRMPVGREYPDSPESNRYFDKSQQQVAPHREMASFLGKNDSYANSASNIKEDTAFRNSPGHSSPSTSQQAKSQPAHLIEEKNKKSGSEKNISNNHNITISNQLLEAIAAKTQKRVEKMLRDQYVMIKKPEPNAMIPLVVILVLTYMIAILTTALILKQLNLF